MQRYIDLGHVEVDDEDEPHEIRQTEKGERYMSGYERTKLRLDETFRQTKERIAETVKKHGDKSANGMVQEESIKEAKENQFRKDLK